MSRVAIRICKGCRKWLVQDRKPAMGVLLAGVRRHRLRGARLHGTGVASSDCMETQGQIASGLPNMVLWLPAVGRGALVRYDAHRHRAPAA